MVLFLPGRKEQQPTTAQRFSDAFGAGLEALSTNMQQRQQQQQMNEAANQLGIDPAILSMPEGAQKAYFQQKFAAGPKPLNALQESQRDLAIARQKQIEENQKLFGGLMGGPQSKEPQDFQNQVMQEPQEGQGEQLPETKAAQKGVEQPQFDIADPKSWPDSMISKLRAFKGQPGQQGIFGNLANDEAERRESDVRGKSKKESEYFKINEPKVMELAETNRKLRQEEGRYNRLGELFSDPSKFPSSFTAALFTKDGQINDIVYSQLTPEAQEAVKLIIDSTSNIKDTYGSRVTNFDLQTYLRKLPSLLNSPEGKTRVLRDLQIMNRLNQMHSDGIQEIFEEAGGTDKIPFSTAEKKYEKRYGSLEKDLINQFVSPDKGKFDKLPDPYKYLGRKIQNPETGEVFISDGKEWKPFKG